MCVMYIHIFQILDLQRYKSRNSHLQPSPHKTSSPFTLPLRLLPYTLYCIIALMCLVIQPIHKTPDICILYNCTRVFSNTTRTQDAWYMYIVYSYYSIEFLVSLTSLNPPTVNLNFFIVVPIYLCFAPLFSPTSFIFY